LALSDINETRLAETVVQCEGRGVKVTSAVLDVADREAVFAWADQSADAHGHINVVFNNAGVALGASVEAMDIEDFVWLMDINFWGVVHGTQAFLPHLIASGEGHVVNISSVFGLVSIPTQSAYNASKFAVRGFTDALRMELEIAGHPVSATTIHPGGVATNIAKDARSSDEDGPLGVDEDGIDQAERLLRLPPAKAARKIIRSVERNRRRALVGPDAVVFDAVSRLPAGLYQRLLIRARR